MGFFISFFVVGAFWSGHHRAFACARHWSPKLMMPNLFLLCSVAAMPFFTALVSDHYARLVPTVAYNSWLLLVAVCNLWNNSIAVAPPVAVDDLDPEYAAMIRRRGWAVLLGTLTALVLCIINPWLGQPGLMSMPVWRKILDLLHRRGGDPAGLDVFQPVEPDGRERLGPARRKPRRTRSPSRPRRP